VRQPALAISLSFALAAALAGPASGAALEAHSPVLEALDLELRRSMDLLADESVPPYFLAYEVTEADSRSVSSSFGLTLQRREERRRFLDVDLRVGDYGLDNTHPLRGDRSRPRRADNYSLVEVPLEDDIDSIRAVLWRATDAEYKRSLEQYTAVRTNVQVKVEESDTSPDFSPAEAVVFYEAEEDFDPALDEWQERVNRYTALFAPHAEIYRAQASLRAVRQTRWLANSDGTRLQTMRIAYRLDIHALTKADDGMELPRYETFFWYSAADPPLDQQILERIGEMISDLVALRVAPVVDPYAGPALLSGRAAGVFFHEVFGHRIEGHRQKREDEGQTFKSKVGERILPPAFSVVFDPTRSRLGDVDLAGFYRFDNEGVRAQPVEVVENGVFKHFLMSRSPIEGESRSNGHGRRQAGFAVVARQSNLVVDVAEPVTHRELKQQLIDRVVAEDKPFGLLFEDIQGGFTQTGRRIPNAFNVIPILVYRIFPDGREELVRGVDLIGTPLTAFSKVIAADDRVELFNGTCGAESGGVPVAAAAPGILIEQMEVQRKEKSQDRPPLLPAPFGRDRL
jgi:predicted Zn-dependent protease